MDNINRTYECPGCCKLHNEKVCPVCRYERETVDYFKIINDTVMNIRKAMRGETK